MKKNLISAFFGALLSIAIFALAYFFLDQSHIIKFLPRNKTEAIIYFPMLIIAPLFTIMIHELGHLFTGIALGQKFKLIVVGFLGLAEENGKLRLFLNKNLAYFGGIMAVVPKSVEAIDYKVFAKTLIAGPISSLIYGFLCLMFFLKYDSYLNSFFGLSALISFGLFLGTTVPDRSGLMFTDRKRFQRLFKKGITQNSEIAMYQIISQSIIENSFKNIDIEKTFIIEKDEELEMKFWAEYLRFLYYSENKLIDEIFESKNKLLCFQTSIGENTWKSLKID
jgi:hypothetical protein